MDPPPLALRALALAEELGCETSCRPEDGALLHVLAARRGTARVAEIGTGAGAGAAWIASALPPGVPVFTTGPDPALAAAAATLFADDPDVTVLVGSWRDTLPAEAPFDLILVGAADAREDVDGVVGLLAPGGTAYLDDFRPDRVEPDARRDAWLGHPLLSSVEVFVTPERSSLVAVRR